MTPIYTGPAARALFWVFWSVLQCTLTGYIIRVHLASNRLDHFFVLRAALILGGIDSTKCCKTFLRDFGPHLYSQPVWLCEMVCYTAEISLQKMGGHHHRWLEPDPPMPAQIKTHQAKTWFSSFLCCPILLSPFKCQPQFPVHSWQKEHSLWCFAAVDHICLRFLRCCVFSDVLLCILSVNHFCLFSAQNSLSFDVWHQ